MALELVISRAAKTDLLEVWVHIAEEDLGAADRVVEGVWAAAKRLAEWPDMGRERPELIPGMRSFPVGQLLIFYRHGEGRVEVVRVIHGRRDLDEIF